MKQFWISIWAAVLFKFILSVTKYPIPEYLKKKLYGKSRRFSTFVKFCSAVHKFNLIYFIHGKNNPKHYKQYKLFKVQFKG